MQCEQCSRPTETNAHISYHGGVRPEIIVFGLKDLVDDGSEMTQQTCDLHMCSILTC